MEMQTRSPTLEEENQELKQRLEALQYRLALGNKTWYQDQQLTFLSMMNQQLKQLNEELSLVSKRILEQNKLAAESLGYEVEPNEKNKSN